MQLSSRRNFGNAGACERLVQRWRSNQLAGYVALSFVSVVGWRQFLIASQSAVTTSVNDPFDAVVESLPPLLFSVRSFSVAGAYETDAVNAQLEKFSSEKIDARLPALPSEDDDGASTAVASSNVRSASLLADSLVLLLPFDSDASDASSRAQPFSLTAFNAKKDSFKASQPTVAQHNGALGGLRWDIQAGDNGLTFGPNVDLQLDGDTSISFWYVVFICFVIFICFLTHTLGGFGKIIRWRAGSRSSR